MGGGASMTHPSLLSGLGFRDSRQSWVPTPSLSDRSHLEVLASLAREGPQDPELTDS